MTRETDSPLGKHSLLIVGVFCLTVIPAKSQTNQHWIGTWTASPMACPVKQEADSLGNSTYSNNIRTTIGGNKIRVRLSNEFGSTALVVGDARISLLDSENRKNSRPLSFDKAYSPTIPAGGFVVSDEIEMPIPPLSKVNVSVYLPRQSIPVMTCHEVAASTNYIAQGNTVKATHIKNARAVTSWHFLKGVDVLADSNTFAVVTLGDSITDGITSTRDANRRWPDFLAVRLQKQHSLVQVAVLNSGISGNRVLDDDVGPSALARFDRDVMAQPGVKCLVLLEGINDIGGLHSNENISAADQLTNGLKELIARAHARGIFVIGGTILPFQGGETFTEAGNKIRETVNSWYKNAGVVDGVADFDQALRDPQHPNALNPKFDSGDHVHPNDAGYAAMANAIDLQLIRSAGKPSHTHPDSKIDD